MKKTLEPFENYVNTLTALGVFPTLARNYNGWTCVLRNSVNVQIMPVGSDQCWGETMLDALVSAVDGLNARFADPAEMHKYISSGVCQNIETLLANIESLHLVKTKIKNAGLNQFSGETDLEDFFH